MIVTCKHCRKQINVEGDIEAGDVVPCPYCGGSFAFSSPVRVGLPGVRSPLPPQSSDEEAPRPKPVLRLRRRAFGGILLVVACLLGGGTALFVALNRFGYMGRLSLPSWLAWIPAIQSLNAEERVHIDAFSANLRRFKVEKLELWRTAPRAVKPKNAVVGAAYHVLVEKKDGACGLYRMTAKGNGVFAVAELTPFGKPLPVKLSDFNKARKGTLQLIECEGTVYVCGAKNVAAGRLLLQRFIP